MTIIEGKMRKESMNILREIKKIMLLGIILPLVSPISSPAETINYVYDNLNRLIRVENLADNKVIIFQYDEVGNRTQKGIYGPLSVTVTQGANGTISPGTVTVLYDSNKTFSITPNTGYEISNVLTTGGVSRGPISEYTFYNIASNQTITASFVVFTAPAYIDGTEYSTLQAAYDAAANGATIKVRARNLTENMNVNRNISVNLHGGCNAAWTCDASSGNTVLKGKIQTYAGGGTLTIKNFVLATQF